MDLLQQNISRQVYASSQPGITSRVGMQLGNQSAMRRFDLPLARTSGNSKDFMGFLFGYRPDVESAPRVRVSIRVFTPEGRSAVKIRL